MATLDSSQSNAETAPETDSTATDDLSLSIPDDASQAEAAAITAAISAHVIDRQRAGATQQQDTERVSEWTLAGRLASVGKRVLPSDVERGKEWQAAARVPY